MVGTLDLSPAFRSDWLWYEAATADAEPAEVTATPTLTDGSATVVIKLNGSEEAGDLTFVEGPNTVTIEVTVGDETAIYTVWVTYTAPTAP